MKPSSQEINQQAGEWAARMEAGELSAADEARLEAWLAADPRHLGAFARCIAALERLDRIRAVGTGAVRPIIDSEIPAFTHRRAVLAGGAGLAAAGVAGAVIWNYRGRTGGTGSTEEYVTSIGETRTVTLSDGSVMTLNTNSRIDVGFTPGLRRIQLVQGEALFNVAKNKKRPFIVTAGDTQVRAVGTSFTVRLLQQRPVQILVQEGVVEVTRRNVPAAAPVRAIADTQAVVPPDAPIAVRRLPYTKVARTMAWQYGQIAFDNETLAEAAEEFGRYSNTKIVVEPAVAGRTITGLFASNDPAGFAKAAAAVLNLHTDVGSEEIRIYR